MGLGSQTPRVRIGIRTWGSGNFGMLLLSQVPLRNQPCYKWFWRHRGVDVLDTGSLLHGRWLMPSGHLPSARDMPVGSNTADTFIHSYTLHWFLIGTDWSSSSLILVSLFMDVWFKLTKLETLTNLFTFNAPPLGCLQRLHLLIPAVSHCRDGYFNNMFETDHRMLASA